MTEGSFKKAIEIVTSFEEGAIDESELVDQLLAAGVPEDEYEQASLIVSGEMRSKE
jgi:hypothetical protein